VLLEKINKSFAKLISKLFEHKNFQEYTEIIQTYGWRAFSFPTDDKHELNLFGTNYALV